MPPGRRRCWGCVTAEHCNINQRYFALAGGAAAPWLSDRCRQAAPADVPTRARSTPQRLPHERGFLREASERLGFGEEIVVKGERGSHGAEMAADDAGLDAEEV